MSEQLNGIDLPNLLYWEIVRAAEEKKRTVVEEVISRLWQSSILTAALPREEEIDLAAFCRYILSDIQNLKPTELQLEFIRLLAGAPSPLSGSSASPGP